MSDTNAITLNGKAIEVPEGSTIREAAESQGVHIPTFCHDDRLKPFASCFLCVVEVEKARGLVPACSTPVASGMVIQTDSTRVTKSRKMALDLMLSDHAGDCVAPCEATCPANIDIQGYIAHIANGEPNAAVRLIKERNPLPVICGRICPHPCESQCRRSLVDEPVAINPLKRFAADHDLQEGPFLHEAGPESGQRVAIVGGGPAGLSAAFYLRRRGHAVEIFEALPELGGMARYGIPRFRMPWEMMDREAKAIIDMGVTVHFNKRLGSDFTIADLKAQGFGSVLLAIGAHKPKPMRVENEEAEGVIGGVDFLREVVLGNITDIGKKVAVIGGGDTAMDCARVSRRLGADVTLLYRRTQAEMPALPLEQEETIGEGVDIRFLTAPTRVILEGGRAVAMEVLTMELGEPDESGRRRPVPIEGSEEILEFDTIIPAIGQDPDMSCIDTEPNRPETTRWNTFVYDEDTQTTSQEGVFAAGDCAFGPDILIRAIAEGKRAADAIDLYLRGAPVTLSKPYAISRGRLADLNKDDFSPRFEHKKRAAETTHPAEKRMAKGGYAPINVSIDQAQAMAEATRCIECGCSARFDCDLRHYATQYNASEKPLAGEKRSCAEDKRHPLIRIEADKCITCGSCVRICTEVRRIDALAFIQRGFGTRIGPNFNDPLQDTGCDACGMCIDVCPTGAIAPNTSKEAGPWNWQTTLTTCTACSRGCALNVHTNEGHVVKVQSVNGDPVNGAVICAEGRFSYQLLANVSTAQGDINKARETLTHAKRIAVIVSPRLTVEQHFAAMQLAQQFNASLHYLTGGIGRTVGNSKITGEANLALLHRLGATPWSAKSVDCILSVASGISRSQAGETTLIALATPGTTPAADQTLSMADPLMIDGALLNRDGALSILHGNGKDRADPAGLSTLQALGSTSSGSSLAGIRTALAEIVEELAGLTKLNGDRLITTKLEIILGGVGPDCREAALKEHMVSIGLS